jgi:monoamine oxidase
MMYDPLHDKSPGCGKKYPDSYWADVSTNMPVDDGQVKQDIDVDVAIIGAGYTGLSCALHLAREHGIKAHVLEANNTAWGCSGRNAGFILKSSGRKSYTQMSNQWGEELMRGNYIEM